MKYKSSISFENQFLIDVMETTLYIFMSYAYECI